MIVCCVIDDGRPDVLRQATASIERHGDLIDKIALIEDAGQPDYSDALRKEYDHFDSQVHHETRRGLAGAVRSAWETAWEMGADYVFHSEGDFTYNCDIPLADMVRLLDDDPLLAQVALYRQPVNAEEVAIGGYMNAPGRFIQCDGFVKTSYLFTLNPSLIPIDVTQLLLAECDDFLERGLTDTLLDFNFHFGIYGSLTDPPRVSHIGEVRSAGYRW